MSHTLVGLSGSLRAGSVNTMLLREAARLYAADTYIEADLNLPLYDGDAEADDGLPDAVSTLVQQISQADGVVISTPEYNSGISGVLKNALDWISRAEQKPWAGKPVVLMSAAAGRSGGALGQAMLRQCMVPFRANILPAPNVMVANASAQFDDNGQLITESYVAAVTEAMTLLRAAADS